MDVALTMEDELRQMSTISESLKKSSGEIMQSNESPSEWNKCIELLDRKKETDEKISQQVTLVANLGKAFDEGIQQKDEEEEQQEDGEEKEILFDLPPSTLSANEMPLESVPKTEQSFARQQHQDQQNALATRARRSKRLYSPSPPPFLMVDSAGRKKKKEKSVDEFAAASVSSQPLQIAGAPCTSSLLKWAKAPPSSSLSSSLDSNGIAAVLHDLQTHKEKLNKRGNKEKANESAKNETEPREKATGSEQSKNVQLMRQNEKLTRENVQLKQRNQEQQQQIQALIGANRELIWAFNESRREHDELMQQLRVMAKLVDGNSTRLSPAVIDEKMQFDQQTKNVRSKQTGKRNTTENNGGASAGGGRQRKKQCTGMVYVAQEHLPPSLAILKKKPTSASHTQQNSSTPSAEDQQATAFEQMPSEQLKDEVKKGIIRAVERRQKAAAALANRDEEVDKIKDHLSKMAPDPNLNKLIGTRKPDFYTPKEFGDWHSVISSMLRKHFVLQLFEALCPEFNGSNVVDLAVKNPSRADFIQKSLNFVFDAENELFTSSNSRDAYFLGIAEKIFTLREAKERQHSEKIRHNGTTAERIGETARRRTLADVLKPKHIKTTDDGILEGEGADI